MLRREKVAAAFQAWLLSLPARWHRRLATVTPEHVIVYSEIVWLLQHAGSLLPDGSAVASPSGHNTTLSMLSTIFNLLGRHGGPAPVRAPPSPLSWCLHTAAYCSGLQKRGQEGSAVPLQLADHHALLDALAAETAAAAAGSLEQLVLISTTATCSFMWDGCRHGRQEVGHLEVADY